MSTKAKLLAELLKKSAPVGALGLGVSDDSEAGVISKGGRNLIEAWHGSPHKFDKFSMDNIGTGEGAQVYGHGLYFADSEDVAKGYRDRLSTFDPYGAKRPKISTVDGVPAQEMGQDVWEVADTLASKDISLDDYIDELRTIKAASTNPSRQSVYDGLIEQAESVRPEVDGKSIKFDKGALYRAHIDVDPDTLLDWDKPLSEQNESVRGAVYDAFPIARGDPDLDFRDIMNNADDYSADEISGMLKNAGIPGIRYKDGMSRGGDGGTSNYVMFDDKPISIVERGFADPRLLAGTAGATGLMAKLIRDSQDDSTVRAPKNPKTAMLATLLRDGERAVEGSPAEFVYPSGLAPWLERLAYDEKPSKLETAMAIADFM